MRDEECVALLQWALPRMGLRWAGFRKVRRQVCKRIKRRMQVLGIDSVAAYRRRLETTAAEWPELDALCQITISRFYRDRAVCDYLGTEVLPALADGACRDGRRMLTAWSAGCAAGEEPYTLALLWTFAVAGRCPGTTLQVLATDANPGLLSRARDAVYPGSSLRELPAPWRRQAFSPTDAAFRLRTAWRRLVTFRREDVRTAMPDGPFDLILCRNLVFTYLEEAWQRQLLPRLVARLRPGGALVIGIHERLPALPEGLAVWSAAHQVYRRTALD